MGRQVNFYMNADDQAKMNHIVLATFQDIIILKNDMEKQELEFLDTTVRAGYQGESFWISLGRRQDISEIVISPPLKMTIPPFRIKNLIDLERSPLIEFHRCAIRPNEPNGRLIQSGRLYYDAKYAASNYTEWVQKDADFIKFAQKLFDLFKTNLIYKKERGYYYGEGALIDEKNGWNLTI